MWIAMNKLVKLLKLFNETTGTRLEYFNTYSRYWNDVDLKSKYSISQFLRERNYNWFLGWLDRNRFIDYEKVKKEFWDKHINRMKFVYRWVEYYYTNEYGDKWINLLISLLK